MVLKLMQFSACLSMLFENDVEMYGAQTAVRSAVRLVVFENDVEMYGAQTDR